MSTIDSKLSTLIWDLPIRVFHWLLVLSFVLAWLSQGDDRYLDIHVFAGYLFFGLLIFRLIWGIIGSNYAKFSNLPYLKIANYLKTLFTKQRQHYLGHNPAGSWAVFIILGLGLIVSTTGLLTLGGEEQHGPLAGVISFELGDNFHWWHNVIAWFMLGFIGIHILGVLGESWLHKENLTKSMFNGFKFTTIQLISVPKHSLIAIFLICLVIVGTLSYFNGYFLVTNYRPFVGPKLPDNVLWQEACGECHLAYHPSLLPARSWQKMLVEQDNHFAEDLYLEANDIKELETFASKNAAENTLTEVAWKNNRSIPFDESPLRITEVDYWVVKHQDIAIEIWQHSEVNFKGNCQACHLDAEQGTFEDAAMHLPEDNLILLKIFGLNLTD
ncbi:MAG: cytochrome b/b6 domain-containing protein [Candidatus Marithrix sp.]|nr:cytochrome b/b6 domain-containing protein [Candidatus Marithrix sp.]